MVIPRIQVRVVGGGQTRPSVVVNDINARGHLGGPGGGGFDVASPDTGAVLAVSGGYMTGLLHEGIFHVEGVLKPLEACPELI